MGQLRKALTVACALLLTGLAPYSYAQSVGQIIAGKDNTGKAYTVAVDANGKLQVVGSATGGSVYGPDANNAIPTQPGVASGGVYNSTPPTVTNGRFYTTQIDANGNLHVAPCALAVCAPILAPADTVTAATAYSQYGYAFGGLFNGTTWDRARSMAAADGATPTGFAANGLYWFNGTNYDRARGTTAGLQVQGAVASGVTSTGNPLIDGGVFRTTPTTVTNGQAVEQSMSARGEAFVTVCSSASCVVVNTTPDDTQANAINRLGTYSANQVWNGTNWVRQSGATTGTNVQGAKGTTTTYSTAIATGGTSQQAFAANAARNYLMCLNPSNATESLYVQFGSSATVSTASIELAIGASITYDSNFIPSGTVNVNAATTGHALTCVQG
jgi:hypothetical protein